MASHSAAFVPLQSMALIVTAVNFDLVQLPAGAKRQPIRLATFWPCFVQVVRCCPDWSRPLLLQWPLHQQNAFILDARGSLNGPNMSHQSIYRTNPSWNDRHSLIPMQSPPPPSCLTSDLGISEFARTSADYWRVQRPPNSLRVPPSTRSSDSCKNNDNDGSLLVTQISSFLCWRVN